MKQTLSIVCALLLSLFSMAQKVMLSGVVKDGTSGEPLVGASVAVVGTSNGTFTNEKGYYAFDVVKGTYKIEYSYLGYKTQVIDMQILETTKKNIRLTPDAVKIDNVVVTAQARDYNISSTQVGVQTLSMQEIKMVPVLFGENDVLKTLQLMPGVKSAGEGGSGYYVRGGGADQNLILLDDAPIFNASHMMGMFSVFNGDAIQDAQLYKGSMSAEYGGRLSSVLDVSMREGGMESYHGQGGVGLISSRFEVDGPIQKGKSSFLVAGRRTYADLFLKLARDTSLHQTKLYFYDVNYKVTDVINEKNKLTLSGYIGRDMFKFKDMLGTDGGNATATFSWIHLPKDKVKNTTSLIFSRYSANTFLNLEIADAKLLTGVTDLNLKQDCEYRFSNSTVHYGGNVALHRFDPGHLTTSMLEEPIDLQKKTAFDVNVYVDNLQTIRDVVKLQYGIRFSNFMLVGRATQFEYDDNHNVIDSTVYSRGELIDYYPNLEPRVSLTFRINGESSIKAAYTRTCQFMHLVQSSTASLPIDYWMPSTNKVKPQTCSQVSAGYFRNFMDNMFETSVEVYWKRMRNQIDYENGTNLFLNANLESFLLYGHSRSYGIELFAKKNYGDWTGWVSYTLSKSEKQFKEINSGNWFPLRYDRIHDVSVVVMYKLSDKWQFSASWVYSTGDAVTFPSGKYLVDGEYVSYYTERNGYRMPAYHRMDLGATRTNKKTDRFESSWSFSIYNVYNRKNPYMVYFEQVDEDNPDVMQAVKVTLFPIIPSVSWDFRF